MASKYERYVKPRLKEIKFWAEAGASQEEIAEKLKVAYSTFRKYRSEYPELEEALEIGDEAAVEEVEAALFKAATGHTVTIKKQIKVKSGDGSEHIEDVEEEQYIAPNPTAITFYLKNKRPKIWNEKLTVEGEVTGGIEINFDSVKRNKDGKAED